MYNLRMFALLAGDSLHSDQKHDQCTEGAGSKNSYSVIGQYVDLDPWWIEQ